MTELDQDEGLLKRWSRRKAAATAGVELEHEKLEMEAVEPAIEEVEPPPPPPPPSDEDMPPLETLNEDSDYSGFLSPNVSEALRKQALRKLFSSTVFNNVDGLDDYDEDFTRFEPLGDIITADMKFEAEQRARREMEALMEEESIEEEIDDVEAVDVSEDAAEESDVQEALPAAIDPDLEVAPPTLEESPMQSGEKL